jgi:hypothetical protein
MFSSNFSPWLKSKILPVISQLRTILMRVVWVGGWAIGWSENMDFSLMEKKIIYFYVKDILR